MYIYVYIDDICIYTQMFIYIHIYIYIYIWGRGISPPVDFELSSVGQHRVYVAWDTQNPENAENDTLCCRNAENNSWSQIKRHQRQLH